MEAWKDIVGFEGCYMVSNKGRIMSIARVVTYKTGHSQKVSGRMLVQSGDKNGYLLVRLSRSGVAKTFKSHRLVAAAFIPNTEGKPSINHIDGKKNNNHAHNLEWVTNKENMEHASKVIGLNGAWKGRFGDENKASKAVIVGGKRYGSICEAARSIGVDPTQVWRAANRCGSVKGMPAEYVKTKVIA